MKISKNIKDRLDIGGQFVEQLAVIAVAKNRNQITEQEYMSLRNLIMFEWKYA